MTTRHQRTHRDTRFAGTVAALLALAASLAVTFGVLSDNLNASFGPIDDHETLAWLGLDGRLALGDLPSTLLHQTEVGNWPDTPRFRPAYYAVRVLQTASFGDNASAWYLSVMLLFAATCTLGGLSFGFAIDHALKLSGRMARAVVLMAASVVGTMAWSGLGAWTGIAARLGPSEGLGLFGLALALLGMTGLVWHGSSWWWVALLAGTSLSVWAKESFIGVTLLPVLTGAYLFSLKRQKRALLLGLVGVIPFLFVAPIITGHSTDIYGQSTGSERLLAGFEAAFRIFPNYWMPAAVGLTLSVMVWAFLGEKPPRAAFVYVSALAGWSISVLLVDTYVQGGTYTHLRYWAVFDVMKMLMVLGGLALASAAVRRAFGWQRWLALVVVAFECFLLLRVGVGTITSWSSLKDESRTNSVASATFNEGINALLSEGTKYFGVVVSHPVEYEPARAVAQRIVIDTEGRATTYLFPLSYSGADAGWSQLQDMGKLGSSSWHLTANDGSVPPNSLSCAFINVAPFEVAECDPKRSIRINARGM